MAAMEDTALNCAKVEFSSGHELIPINLVFLHQYAVQRLIDIWPKST